MRWAALYHIRKHRCGRNSIVLTRRKDMIPPVGGAQERLQTVGSVRDNDLQL